MARNDRHIKDYEEEILRLKAEGKTKREIGKKSGFSFEQVHNFISRYNEKQRKILLSLLLLLSVGAALSGCGKTENTSGKTNEPVEDTADAKYDSLVLVNKKRQAARGLGGQGGIGRRQGDHRLRL